MNDQERMERNEERLSTCYGPFASRVRLLITTMEGRGFRPRINMDGAWRSNEFQKDLYVKGRSSLKYGFHNVTSPDGKPEALAVDLLDDDSPLSPSRKYLLSLEAEAAEVGLMTGIYFGLTAALRAGLAKCIRSYHQSRIDDNARLGWDPCHVQPRGFTVKLARNGKRPWPGEAGS